MGMDRRRFLRSTALGGAALAATAARPPGVPGGRPGQGSGDVDWSVPESTLPADPADSPIEHIGVLMMENRSYDSYLGWLEGGRGFLTLGLDLEYVDPATGERGRPEHWAPRYRRDHHPDPGHSWAAAHDQYEQGFLAGRNDEYALAYYLAEDVQIFARLARQFTVLDHYFCAVLGPTYPNRFYQHAGTSEGAKSNDFPWEAGHPTGYPFPSIWDRLEAAGIDWAYYFSDLPFAAMFGPRLLHRTRPIAQYYVDAATGRLPKVFFVDPKFLPPYQTDDHPGSSDIRSGQVFVNNVVHAFAHSNAWERGALFINYDEHGGFFDHVTPPRVPDERASSDFREDFGQLGFRTPALAISPYARRGFVHHGGPFEHTSILRFIEWRYDLEPLTVRSANAANIGEVFDHASSPRLEVPIDRLEVPSPSEPLHAERALEVTGLDDLVPEAFLRHARSPELRAMGYRIGEPTPGELFGVGDWLGRAVADAGGAVAGALDGVPGVGGLLQP
jgi:phospholipase C